MPQGVFPSLLHPASQRRSLSLLLGFSAAIILICLFAPSVYAQMSVTATYDGQLYPVVGRKDYFLFVSKKNGDRVRTNYSNLDLRPSKTFGSGVALITNAVPDYNPPKSASTEDKPVAFRYDADISADRKLSDVYALLPAVVNGSICTEILPIGSLSEHQTKHVHFDYASKVENIGFLHVFCAGVEITSSQVKQPYDAAAYFESLKAKSKGVSAAALCKSKRFYAMSLSDDGSHLACAMDRESHFGLLIYDLITMKITGEVDVGALKDPIFDLRWVSATQLVYLKGNDLRTNDLYLLDITEQKIRKIANEVTDIVLVLPDTHNLILRFDHNGTWFEKYDVSKRKTLSTYAEHEACYLFFNRLGEPRLKYFVEHNHLNYFYRPTATSGWKSLDESVKQAGLRFNIRGDESIDRIADIFGLARMETPFI